MKKLTAFLVALCLATTFVGCKEKTPAVTAIAYTVPAPFAYPDYTFDSTPDPMTLRQTAVQAMRDILSVQWHPSAEYNYYKSGPVSNREFKYEPGNTYAGILYTNANAGLFQFLEFYNYNSGLLTYPGSVNELKSDIGVSCADAVIWAWGTVCNSVKGPYYPKTMVYKNGYLPVGDYTYDQNLDNFNYYPTLRIVSDNGKEVMAKSYAQVLPADALTTSSDNHAMMAIEPAHVDYLPDGSIDTAKSYVMIQDQRAGGESLRQTDENGNVLNYGGRLSAKFTFDELYDKHFIPVTTAEFMGQKEYEPASVTAPSGNCQSIDALKTSAIEANYPLAVVNVIAEQSGTKTVIDRILFGGTSQNGVPRSFALKDSKVVMNLENTSTSGTVIKIEVVVSTGERFVPIEFTV